MTDHDAIIMAIIMAGMAFVMIVSHIFRRKP